MVSQLRNQAPGLYSEQYKGRITSSTMKLQNYKTDIHNNSHLSTVSYITDIILDPFPPPSQWIYDSGEVSALFCSLADQYFCKIQQKELEKKWKF